MSLVQPVLKGLNEDLPYDLIIDLLKNCDEETVSNLPPVRPKAGDVYVFAPLKEECKNDWKCDQFRWRYYGRRDLQSDPALSKTYYVYLDSDGKEAKNFKRHVYTLSHDGTNNRVLIHYQGDGSITRSAPIHCRTVPSVLRDVEKSEVTPSVAYKRKVSMPGSSNEHLVVQLPRNVKQVKNIQSRFRQRLRFSHDSLYNLHELAYDLDDFVHKIVTYPDLIVICGMKKMLTEMNVILETDSQGSQLLSYDTTFKLGDFYISPFLFHNTLFKKNPVMPAFFMIHERKLKSTHEELMKVVAVALPCLVNGSQTVPCVTDDEKGFELIDEYLPQIRRFLCWNHIINSSKNWLKNHGASSAEVPIYVGNIRDLLHQKSEEDYSSRLGELKVKWSQPFLQHYMKEMHDK
uniref:MULE transposase domain-containing protein n=1 Tax=Amphimedon queenslandica TaxID=400682 RepID=A0A1X7SVU8_AMPQE